MAILKKKILSKFKDYKNFNERFKKYKEILCYISIKNSNLMICKVSILYYYLIICLQ